MVTTKEVVNPRNERALKYLLQAEKPLTAVKAQKTEAKLEQKRTSVWNVNF